MKDATGELNMTVITLVAIGAVGALFYFVIWPIIQQTVMNQTCSTYGNYKADKIENSTAGGNDKVSEWQCCKVNDDGSLTKDCIIVQ